MTENLPRSTYSKLNEIKHRLRAAGALLGVSDFTVRSYTENSGIHVERSDKAVKVRIFDIPTLFEIAQWRRTQGLVKAPAVGSGPVVITVDVVKGGTGKTTTAVETAVHLQMLGLRVLAIDLDVQANLTQAFGYEDDFDAADLESQGLSHEAMIEHTFGRVVSAFKSGTVDYPTSGLIKKPFGEYGPHLIGSSVDLASMELMIGSAPGIREKVFHTLFQSSRTGGTPGFNVGDYDVVILDCPPNVSYTSSAAIVAADLLIAPVRMDAFGFKGLTRLMQEIESLEEVTGQRPELIILPTHYSPQMPRIRRMQKKLDEYAALLAPCVINTSEEFPKCTEQYIPLSLQKPTSTPAQEYQVFAEYIREKVMQVAAEKAGKVKS